MDHRDAWHLNVYTGKRVGNPRNRSNRLERRLISNATEAWFVNKPIRDWHAREYPSRASDYHVVSNGFDPNFLELAEIRIPDPEHLVFGYLGTIYGPIPLRETLEGWRIARSRSPLLRNASLVFRGRLGHFAEPDPEAAALLEEFKPDGVSYGGPVSKAQVASVYNSFDALLLIISRSKFVTSGKVFEYAATGLPIAALHHPETAATDVLEGHPAHFPVQVVSAEEIASSLIATGERAASATPDDRRVAQEWARHLARDEQLLPRIEALRSRITAGTA
jgi:glycosyltransferase involved in cell wall biosynthesis